MKDSFYFKHDLGARHDPKIQRLMMKHGMAGIGAYWCIVEMLYEQGGKLSVGYIDTIAFTLRLDEEQVRSIIFELDLFSSDEEFFWSDSAIERIEDRATRYTQQPTKRGAPKGNNNATKNNSKTIRGQLENNSESIENNSESIENNSESIENNSESIENNSESIENNSESIENNSDSIQKQIGEQKNNSETNQKQIKNNSGSIENNSKTNRKQIENNSPRIENHIRKDKEEDEDKDLDKELSIGGSKPAGRFCPPSESEVEAYIQEMGYSLVSAEEFVNFYASKKWMVGKNKMVDWKASVRGWESRRKNEISEPAPKQSSLKASNLKFSKINQRWDKLDLPLE